jgi:hypothetical protein
MATNNATKKAPIGQIVAVIVLVVSVTLGLMISGGFFEDFEGFNFNFNDEGTSSTLSPARNLEGTWKTEFATKFFIQIDGEDVGSQDRIMTWIITPTSQESIVNVEVRFSSSNTQVEQYSGYVPDVSPMFLTGTISGTRLTLENTANYYKEPIGEFSFTTDYIQGTWHDHWEMLYEQNVYTSTNGLKLDRQ